MKEYMEFLKMKQTNVIESGFELNDNELCFSRFKSIVYGER